MLLQQKVVVSQSCGGSAGDPVPCADHLKDIVTGRPTNASLSRSREKSHRPQVKRQVATFVVSVIGARVSRASIHRKKEGNQGSR